MKHLIVLLLLACALRVNAQSDDGIFSAKKLALDTTISGAIAFNTDILNCSQGYTLEFTDKQRQNELVYLYEHTSKETLKFEYHYQQGEPDSTGKTAKPTIIYQRIIGDNNTITQIYNCIFGEAITAEQLQAFSTMGTGFGYKGRDYHYTLLPDDYKPGYWVLTFTH